MEIKFVIKSLVDDPCYYDSNNNEFTTIEKAVMYSSYEEAQGRIATKLPEGVYQIDKIFVKE